MNSAFEYFIQRRLETNVMGSLYLWECSVCFALVRYEKVPDHFTYHGIA